MTNEERLLKDIKETARVNGIKIRIYKDLIYLPGEDFDCSGCFDEDDKSLSIAKGIERYDYISALVHESCHMDQWIEDSFLWEKCKPGYDLIFDWIDHHTSIVKRELLEEAFQDSIRLELDCEKRAVKKIIDYQLFTDFEIEQYIKGANAYIYGYLYAFETKKWLPNIYMESEIVSLCPSKFKNSYHRIPVRVHRAFNKHFNISRKEALVA